MVIAVRFMTAGRVMNAGQGRDLESEFPVGDREYERPGQNATHSAVKKRWVRVERRPTGGPPAGGVCRDYTIADRRYRGTMW
jgi:hypothetical protein